MSYQVDVTEEVVERLARYAYERSYGYDEDAPTWEELKADHRQDNCVEAWRKRAIKSLEATLARIPARLQGDELHYAPNVTSDGSIAIDPRCNEDNHELRM